MAKLLTDLFYTALDLNGVPLSGAKLEFFVTGTSTPLAIYTDDALAVAHTNPVVADSAGRFAPIYLQDADYKAILSTFADVVIDTVDPVHGSSAIPTTGTLSKSVDYTVVAGDKGSLILVDASSGDKTITLLGVTDEFTIGVKKIDSSANTVTVDGNAAETIDGDLTQVLEAQYDGISLRSDAVAWHVESRFDAFPPATASKTASYEVLTSDNGRTILVDATTVTFAAGIQEDNSGASFIDETTDLNSAAANDVALFPAGAGENDAFYFGSAGKFAGLSVNTGTIGVGAYVVSWEYWNGSAWTALSGLVDGTDAFKTIGAQEVTFQIPSDWDTTTVNSQGPFYYIRARRNAGTVTTDPLATQATIFTTVLLPPAATAKNGFSIGVKKTDITTNTVTVAATAAETIDGAASRTFIGQYESELYLSDGIEWFAVIEVPPLSSLTLETPQATTSGASVDFTGIPSTAKRITVMFDGVSQTSTGNLRIIIGDAGGFEATGYESASGSSGVDAFATDGFIVLTNLAANFNSGQMILTLMDETNNTWVSSHGVKASGAAGIGFAAGGGAKSLSDTLTQIRVTLTAGAFDAGSVNISVE